MTKEHNHDQCFRYARNLSIFTIIYNIIEGFVSMYFGITEDTLSLFGFGADSFIEAVSAGGILYLTYNSKKNANELDLSAEKVALRITGFCFYLLASIILIGMIHGLYVDRIPDSTIPGIVITSISILIMWYIIREKTNLGKHLGSDALLEDAECSRVCIYMSIAVLLSTLIYELTKYKYSDVLGEIGIIYFSIKEGRESFKKAKGESCHCH